MSYFIKVYGDKTGKDIQDIDRRSLALLQSYQWPGNIRELQHVIEEVGRRFRGLYPFS